MNLNSFITPLAALALAISAATGQVPNTIAYQAFLTDDNGDPLSPDASTNYDIEFRLFQGAQGGAALWAESQTVSVFGGNFSTQLGTGDPIPGGPTIELQAAFGGAERYLEITISEGGTPKTFSPRQQLVAAPFAFRAKRAEEAVTVTDGAITAAKLGSGAVTAGKLADSAVTAATIAPLAVTASHIKPDNIYSVHIVDGEVNTEDLASSAVTNAKLAPDAVGTGKIIDGTVRLDDLNSEVKTTLGSPIGSIVIWPATVDVEIPDGWKYCDGSRLSRTEFPELHAVIGDHYFGSNASGFAVPDLRESLVSMVNGAVEPSRTGVLDGTGAQVGNGHRIHYMRFIIRAK